MTKNSDHKQNLLHLNKAEIYVFPTQPLSISYQINTFKAAQVRYYGKSDRFGEGSAKRNYPAKCSAKKLAIRSSYQTFIIAHQKLEIPNWIRLGKWAAKIKLQSQIIPNSNIKEKSRKYIFQHPLKNLDLPISSR